MNLQAFLSHLKQNGCRLINGKQQELFNTVRKYGYEGENVQSAIQSCCPPKFRPKLQELIKVIPLEGKQLDLVSLAQELTTKFIKEKFVRHSDLLELIHFIRDSNQESMEKIAFKYGMRQEYEKDFTDLIPLIQNIQKQLINDAKCETKWKQFEQVLMKDNQPNRRGVLSLFLEGQTIDSPYKLRQVALKNQIFLIKDKEIQLFDVINNLGLEHKLSEQTIKSSTYEAFFEELDDLCDKIIQRKPLVKVEEKMPPMIELLKVQLFLQQEDILNLVQSIYNGKKEQVNRIVGEYCIQHHIQKIKSNLEQFISHLKEEFRVYEVAKIIQHLEHTLYSMKTAPTLESKEEQKIENQIDYESELSSLKSNLKEQYMVEQEDFNKLIFSFYSNKMMEFYKVATQYSLESYDGLIHRITEKLNSLVANLGAETQVALKRKIYEFLKIQTQTQKEEMVKQQVKPTEKDEPQKDKKQQKPQSVELQNNVEENLILQSQSSKESAPGESVLLIQDEAEQTIVINSGIEQSDYYIEDLSKKQNLPHESKILETKFDSKDILAVQQVDPVIDKKQILINPITSEQRKDQENTQTKPSQQIEAIKQQQPQQQFFEPVLLEELNATIPFQTNISHINRKQLISQSSKSNSEGELKQRQFCNDQLISDGSQKNIVKLTKTLSKQGIKVYSKRFPNPIPSEQEEEKGSQIGQKRSSSTKKKSNKNYGEPSIKSSIYEGGNDNEVDEQQIHLLFKNPFEPTSQSNYNDNDNTAKVLFIYFSEDVVHEITLAKLANQKEKKNIVIISNNYTFANINFTLASFRINKNMKYLMKIVFSKIMSTRTQEIKITAGKSYSGCKLVILQDTEIKVKNRETLNAVLDFALFESIHFLLKKVIQKKIYVEDDIFVWLKLLYDKYKQIDPQNLAKILAKIEMSKELTQLNSQFFIYFFYSIYRQKALVYYEQYSLAYKFKFSRRNIERYINKNYPLTIELYNFYMCLNLLDALSYPSQYGQLAYKIILMNIIIQSPKNIFQILMTVANRSPKMLARLDENIKQLFRENQILCFHDYFNLRSRYIKYLLEEKSSQQRILMEFIEFLLALCYRKNHTDCKKKIDLRTENLQNLFCQSSGRIMISKTSRVGDGALPILYSQCKTLYKLSNRQFDFIELVMTLLKLRAQTITKFYTTDIFLSLIMIPMTKMDKQFLETHKIGEKLHTYHIKQVVTSLVCDNQQKYDTDKFQDIITEQFSRQNQVKEAEVIILLIDQLSVTFPNDKFKISLLHRLFAHFSRLTKVVDDIISRKFINTIKFKIYLQTYFKIKNEIFKSMFITKIFSELKLNYANRQEDIFAEIERSFPKYIRENEPKVQHLIDLYLENNEFDVEKMEKHIFNFLKSNNSYINKINKFDKKIFEVAFQNIIARVNGDDIYAEDVISINQSIKEEKVKSSQLKTAIFRAAAKMEIFRCRVKKIITILQKKNGHFQEDINTMRQYQNRIDKVRLIEAYKIDEKYGELFNYCEYIYIIQQYRFWSYENITNLEDIVKLFKTIEEKLMIAIYEFQQGKITYNNFKIYFLSNNFKDLCQYYFKSENLKKKIYRYNKKINEKQILGIVEYSQSLQYMYSIIKSSDLNISFAYFNEFVVKIEKDEDFLVEECFKEMKEVETKLIDAYGVNKPWNQIDSLLTYLEKEESAKIVHSTQKARKMFEMIRQKNLDPKSITDLKEYINDLENSILKMETIKQFQNVLFYWQLVKNAPNFNRFIVDLNDFIKNKKVDLSNCIDNCFASYKLIEQKMDEAVNRQTSFKYEIEAIFKDSDFEVTSDLKIQITIDPENLDESAMRSTKIQLDEDTKQMVIDYKRMSNYKDKSILLINDIGGEQNIDESMKEMRQLFEKYSKFFGIVEGIYVLSEKLSNYGYNPKDISCLIHITHNDITQIIEKRDQLMQTSKTWLQGIKSLYSKSYLLTHFIGSQLNKFIDNCINRVYNPSLKRIINMSEHQFKDQFQNREFLRIIEEAKAGKPLQRVKFIIEAFQQFQEDYMNSSRIIQIQFNEKFNKRESLFENYAQLKAKPIILLTCSAKEVYSCLVQKARKNTKKIAKPMQVLYCQESTSAEEIEFFLDRAMICPSKTHFIIGAHNLKEEIKLIFCDQLTVLLRQRSTQLKNSQLCFIDDVINDRLYAYVSRPKLFLIEKKELFLKEAEEGTKILVKLLAKTVIVSSKKPGLGKTFYVEQQAQIENKKLKYFPICGNIKFQNLAKRLKKMNLQPQNSLLIQIGHVQNKKKLEVFLSQIIIFRCFYFQEYVFIPENIAIYIQLENIVELQAQDSYHILNILKNHGKLRYIEQFNIKQVSINLQNYDDKFVYIYLSMLSKPNLIAQKQYSYQDYLKEKEKVPYPENVVQLLQKYFVAWFVQRKMQPTYIIFKAFKNMLFNAFKSFSESPFLFIANFIEIDPAFKRLQLQKSRQNFLQVCISNALQFLKETVTTNDFDQDKNTLQSVSQMIRKFPMLIVSSFNFSNYEFIYLNDESVNIPIKSLLLSQNSKYFHKVQNMQNMNQLHQIFKESSLSSSKGEQQQLRMFKILLELSGNKNFDSNIENKDNKGKIISSESIEKVYKAVPQLKNYKLTLDNFFKMCLIIHRSSSYIPCVIMGESGVGKTALINFLVEIVFQQTLKIYNVHAGIHEEDLQVWVKQLKEKALKEIQIANQIRQQIQDENEYLERLLTLKPKRIWVFFDQFNTTDELNYIKQMIVDRRFLGQTLPSNIVFLAACNPYRKKQESINRVRAGIKKTNQNRGGELAFKVKPPSLSLIQLMWDYQQLGEKENESYIQKMLAEIKYSKKDLLIKCIVETHELFKRTVEVSSVSLRDVARFKELYNWFLIHTPTKNKKHKQHPLADNNKRNDYVAPDPAQRAAILSFIFCYALRYSTSTERKVFLQNIEIKLKLQKHYMQKVLQNEQRQYINQLKVKGQKIAYNSALMENVFTSLVCLMNKIPILIIGNPGSSKSLSIKMLNSNLRGENSTALFCQDLPEINMIYYQGSEASTSKGVEQVFEKATSKNVNDQYKKWNILNCILFDQIGLAEKSIHNPLKVLHAKLETNIKEIGFIGISNWQLDAAKMSRFLVISRSNPDENEIKDTAVKIYQSYLENDNTHIERFKLLGSHYYKFINNWNINLNNRQGFFGLRDFYSYIKYVCAEISKHGNDPNQIDKAVATAIQINFDGQKESLKLFRGIASTSAKNIIDFMNPIELVNKNLEDTESRCLMLIIRGDSLIPIINDKIKIKGVNRKAVCVYGSTFLEDQQSEEYNLEVTSLIINHVSRGNILAFKDINNSIQTSLYDLFNKSFSQIGNKKYCRIAVGANSNPKCNVHQNFNAIVYVDQQKLRDLDLAFLNRFEKHYLNLKSMITNEQIQILKDLTKWIEELLNAGEEDLILKNENFIINSSQESIVTLMIKYRGQENMMNKIKADLLKNRTTDLTISIKDSQEKEDMVKVCTELSVPVHKCIEDMIVFTYDQFSNLAEEKTIFNGKNYIIRLSEIKNEKGLRKQLKTALTSDEFDNVEIKVYYQNHFMHINFLLFLAKEIKNTLESKKQIIIIIQLHRFSLHQLNIENINISYLHKFQQYFIQDTHSLTEIPELLQSKYCWEIYKKLNLSDNFGNYYMDALKLIKFKCQFEQIELLKEEYFVQCLEISTNEYFKDNTQKILEQYLKKKRVDYNAIQKNAEDIMRCSNIKEALEKYIAQMIKQLIFYSIKMVIEEGFLFYFIDNRSIKTLDVDTRDYLRDSYFKQYKKLVQFFHIHYEQQRNKLITKLPKLRQQIKFQKAIQSNIVRIKSQRSLISSSFKDFDNFFQDKENKGNKNLQEISNRIPFFRTQQNENEYEIEVINAKNFIENDFKISSHEILIKIAKNKDLQKLYLYDLLTFYLKQNNQSQKYICLYIEIMTTIFEQFDITEKLIIFTNDKKIMTNIFQLFGLFFEHEKPMKIFEQIGNLMKKDQGNVLIQLLKTLFNIGMQIIHFSKEIIKNFKSVSQYMSYFRLIFIKMRQISISYGEYGLQFTKAYLTTNKLLEMFEKIEIKNEQLVELYIKETDENHTIYFCIYQFCSKLLEDERIKNEKQIIINFLSLDIFCNWLEKIEHQQEFEKEKQECIDNFVKMCNKYTLFANNSVYFISLILPELDNTESIQEILEYFSSEQIHYYVKEESIDMESNFTVALSNHISSQIEEIFAEELKNSVETEEEIFITKNYEQQFIHLMNNLEDELKIFKLFKIQFMKRYAFYYLQLLSKNEENELQNRIDILLCQENELMRHIRIYLLKHLYINYESFEKIKKYFVQQNRCKWIIKLKELLDQKENEFFIPPKVLQNNNKLYKLMTLLTEKKYSDRIVFHDLILEGLRNEPNRYELLTYFMLTFYTKSIAQNFIFDLRLQLNTRTDLKDQKNRLIRELLYRYLDHRVFNNFSFTTNEEFMKQLPLLNYLNIFVASCRAKNPLNDMFFNRDGNVENDYAAFLNNRFLIGSMKNPALGRLEFILKRQSQNFAASSYINCSKNCDYISPVGGNFYGTYDGCANPYHQSKCAFCNNTIGAHAYNQLTNPEAKKFMPNNVQQMMPVIQAKIKVTLRKIDTNFEYSLLGYTLGNTIKQLKESMQLKKHYTGVATDFLQGQSQMIHYKLLQTIINFVWYFLVEVNLIKQNSLQTIFKYDLENSKIFLNEATNFYFQQTNKSVKFGNQNGHIIWHLGIGKMLINFLTSYNEKQPVKLQGNNLTDSIVRDNFEKNFEEFIFPYCQKEKEKLILESRVVKTINKTDIVREIGDLKQHLLQYPQLKLYKLLKIELSPSYQNLKRQYKETLAKDYPILSYLMNNETVEEKLKHFKTIYTFISKLWKIFNLQITRQDSKKPLNEALASIFKDNDKERKQMETQTDQFVKSWNRLAQLKYQLKHECHDFGELQKIDKTHPLGKFLLDKDHMDNVDGRKLIGFIIVSVNEYNSICGIIENSVKAAYSQQSTQIFSSNLLNPTLLNKDSKVLLFPTEALAEKIEKYSSFSVQYGISNPSYPFDQIQSMIAKEFYGCKYLISEDDKFCYINYIGQQVHFITELREDQNQKTLEQTSMKPRIKQYLKNLEREETFYKTIKSIQGSLENIVIFFKNYKGIPNMHTMTIRNFVNEKRIKGIVKEVLEQPIQSLPLSNLADFYEMVQFLTYEKVKDMLDKVFKKELEKPEKQEFLALVRRMKSEERQAGIPSYADFKVALYRLAGRNLLLMLCDQKKFLSEQLCYVAFYWPKDVDIDYFQRETTLFTEVMGKLTISKVGDMLNYIPFPEKEAEQAGISKVKGPDINQGRKIEKVLDHRPKVRTHKNRNQLD